MTLRDRCSQGFSHNAWRQGEQIYHAKRAAIDAVGDDGLAATVAGSQGWMYTVHLDWADAGKGLLVADCECAQFEEGHACKHIAAAVLAADRAGIQVPGDTPLKIDLGQRSPTTADPVEDEYWIADDDEADILETSKPLGGGLLDLVARKIIQETKPQAVEKRAKGATSAWKKSLQDLRTAQEAAIIDRHAPASRSRKPAARRIWYGLDLARTQSAGVPYVGIRQRSLKRDGTPGKITKCRLARAEISALESADDRTLVGLLIGNEADWSNGYYSPYGGYGQEYTGAFVSPAMIEVVFPKLCSSGRFGWIDVGDAAAKEQIHPLGWDDGPAWQFRLNVTLSDDKKRWQLQGELARGDETANLAEPLLLLAAGIVVFDDRIARLAMDVEAFQWVALLRGTQVLEVPVKQQDELIEQLAVLPEVPRGNWPAELSWQDERPAPKPVLRVAAPAKNSWRTDLGCRLEFVYGDWRVTQESGEMARFDAEARRVVHRDLPAEAAARDQLLRAGAKKNQYAYDQREPSMVVEPKKLSGVVQQMAAAGWEIEAEGRMIRRPGEFKISITSGVDWFDLEATCDFDGVKASLPRLLEALRRGETIIELDDGSRGMLPADWLARYAPLAELGEAQGDHVRFVPTQAALLDALLAAQDSQDYIVDEAFTRLRERIRSFQGVEPQNEPATFAGELRHYQREGLGWLHFLQDFSFGGCLADDMGLGKTIQVLALLEEQRLKQLALPNGQGPSPFPESAQEKGTVPLGPSDGAQENGTVPLPANNGSTARSPSLVVVPRSLIFNWIEEAKRFTPQLRVLNYTGLERRAVADQLTDYDVVLTTYGTLRRDIVQLKDIQLDYAILDEAQAVKNASSQAAKAVRLLKARHRLAMTGTPVENHLGELWSLLEFLNPGMLGRSGKLTDLFIGRRTKADGTADRNEAVGLLARALRPFILRRTKQQVLTELPPKTEQTLYCELDGTERKLYDELREHYRQSLLARVSRDGVNKSKIHVLEALLRLRQAACHPGLLDKKKVGETSSKLEALLEQLAEIVAEGHKALVFSQFTSLLAIVRRQLDERKIVYEYLDGKTVKRQDHVERFQNDPACPLFLISLKAGGQGLNLTAADYVFILDPWWNPAVEAQAVDRAHRIGQDRHVFAYRLIARDTVEEKILQLQANKRDLADAIISADNSLLRSLTAEDLQLLLS